MEIKNLKPEIRYLSELKNVLYDQEWAKTAPNFPVYYMYRKLRERFGIEYDITIIPPNRLGREFVKTKGHYHTGEFWEVYQVLSGEGIFLMQRGEDEIEEVYFVRGKRGNFIFIPPYFAHITINPSRKVLKIANWVPINCERDYNKIEEKRGGCYYYTLEGWIKNENYKFVPNLKFKRSLKKFPVNKILQI